MTEYHDISTDEIELSDVSEQDKRCAPHLSFENGSCIRLEILVKMAEAYNMEFPDNPIDLDNKIEILHPHRYKKYLVKQFTERLREKCNTQRCWAEQGFIRRLPKIAQKEVEKYVWRPQGSHNDEKWLNTTNINEVMSQYEIKYPEFKFLGAVPRDFQDHEIYRMDQSTYRKLWKAGKTKIGIVYNTDPVGAGGEHWNALFADFENGEVFFFDSYGIAPNREVKAHMSQIEQFIRDHCNEMTRVNRNKKNLMKCKNVKVGYNKERHQRKNSACGVFSINFIIRMLKGEGFENICNSRIHDDIINKCRKVYFNKNK
jgi:hypothetical protein